MSTVEQIAPPQESVYTPEDLLVMPDGDQYELVDGALVERDMSGLSSWVGGETGALLRNFAKEHNSGWVFPADCTYQCFPDAPNKVRKPDVSFIKSGRLPGEAPQNGHIRIAPNLVVEVLSRHDVYEDMFERIEDFLNVGVELVWLISPRLRTVQVFRPNGSAQLLHEGDELNGEDVLPGFRCPVAALFPPVAATAPAP